MDAAVKERYQEWLEAESLEDDLRAELEAMTGDEKKITDAFFQDLGFGTGGLRGIMGAGTNRMNVHTVRKATQGYADYLNAHFTDPAVAIAHDSRLNGTLFSEKAAEVLAANGVKVWMYPELMPSPALAFAIRHLRLSGGINITASHNPSKYNGYKVDSPEGGSIAVPVAKEISSFIKATDTFKGVKAISLEEAERKGLFEYIGEDTVTSYIDTVSRETLLPDGNGDKALRIVYTPLNGAGLKCVTRCLKENGYTDIRVVKEQAMPDGRFPTCPYPNPEIREALGLGLRDLKACDGDLLLATDPDSDRIGAAVIDGDDFRLFSGNEMGVLLLDFIAKRRIELGTFPEHPVAVKSIVSTDMAYQVASDYGIELRDVLTGSKYMGEQIQMLEEEGHPERFLLGFEESYGYLTGTYIQDKDGVNGALVVADMAAYYKKKGMTLIDAMDALYEKHGERTDTLYSFAYEGAEGMAGMNAVMSRTRENPPLRLGGEKVVTVNDYLLSTSTTDGHVTKLTQPSSNVLKFLTEGGSSVIVRPSGTEPKLKLYLSVKGGKDKEESLRKEAMGLLGLSQ